PRVGPHLRLALALCHLPVDGANIVAGHIVADLVEVQTSAAQSRAVTPGENARSGLTGKERKPARAMLQADQTIERYVYGAVFAHARDRGGGRHRLVSGGNRDKLDQL